MQIWTLYIILFPKRPFIICFYFSVLLLSIVHKAHREELECVLQVLEKALIYLPELLGRRWQCHSLTRIMTKLLHPGNSWKLRRDAMRSVSLLTVSNLFFNLRFHLIMLLFFFQVLFTLVPGVRRHGPQCNPRNVCNSCTGISLTFPRTWSRCIE